MEPSYRTLTPEEERVIVHKGTEKPFTGKYETFTGDGIYTCRRCGAALYRSEDKFDAHCGWPAFDDEIPGAVTRKKDADGRRTEILCATGDAHLGHVFLGEHLTLTDTRHCVNSISMDFVATADMDKHFKRAIFAGGCFWCVEAVFEDLELLGLGRQKAGAKALDRRQLGRCDHIGANNVHELGTVNACVHALSDRLADLAGVLNSLPAVAVQHIQLSPEFQLVL